MRNDILKKIERTRRSRDRWQVIYEWRLFKALAAISLMFMYVVLACTYAAYEESMNGLFDLFIIAFVFISITSAYILAADKMQDIAKETWLKKGDKVLDLKNEWRDSYDEEEE